MHSDVVFRILQRQRFSSSLNSHRLIHCGVKTNMRLVLFLAPLMLVFGCSKSENPSAVSASQNSTPAGPTAAELDAISAIEAAQAKVSKTPNGFATSVDFRGTEFTDELLSSLGSLTKATAVNFAETSLNDEQLEKLVQAGSSLNNFDLRGCAISDSGLKTLASLTNVRAIRLSGKNGQTTVTDDGLAHLSELKSLKLLALDDLWIGTPGIAHLIDLASLTELYLAGTLIDDESIALVAKLPNLQKLRLARTSVGDTALEALTACGNLQELDLSEDSLLTDVGMASLGRITSLKKLNLWRVQITDTGALALAPLSGLNWLNLDNTKLSDEGLPALANMNQLTFLHLGSTQITEQGASALFHLKTLADLKITRTAMGASADALAKLTAELPDTAIQTEYEGE